VPFLLTIRHETQAAAGHFGADEIARFDLPRVRVGAGEDCEQRVPDGDFPGLAFAVLAKDQRLRLEPAPGVPVRVNGKDAAAGQELRSGDELHVGAWSCRIHKIYGNPEDRRRRTGVARLARILVILVLLAELAVVVWLPRQVETTARRGHELARQRVFAMVDNLRRQARPPRLQEGEVADPFRQAVRRAIEEDLERRARYLRQHQHSLTPAQCQRMLQELEYLAGALDRLANDNLLQPIPGVDLEAAVRAALVRANWSTTTP
jgi:hypothetical protein